MQYYFNLNKYFFYLKIITQMSLFSQKINLEKEKIIVLDYLI